MSTRIIRCKIINNTEYGTYTVLSESGLYDSKDKIKCICKCGNIVYTCINNLKLNRKHCKKCSQRKHRKYRDGDIVNGRIILKIVSKRYLLVRCTYCNIEKEVCKESVYKCSCECQTKRYVTGNKSHAYTGYKNITGVYFSSIKLRAKKKNYDYDLDIYFLQDLLEKQNFKCALSGVTISLENSKNNTTASLDRINSNKGYTKDNVQWVHKDVNKMKQDLQEEYFIDMCNNIVKHKTLKTLQ